MSTPYAKRGRHFRAHAKSATQPSQTLRLLTKARREWSLIQEDGRRLRLKQVRDLRFLSGAISRLIDVYISLGDNAQADRLIARLVRQAQRQARRKS